MPRVTEINVYPIKSCGRVARRSEAVGARGFDGDRRYMLVDDAGRFLSQREHPRMALIRVEDDADGYVVEAPGRRPLRLPRAWPEGVDCEVTVWRSVVRATAVDDSVSNWFGELREFPCRLVYMADDQHRAVSNPAARAGDEVGFADGGPLLLISAASLAELNSRLATPVTMRRFRPNLVVSAEAPFDEDAWRYLRIGQAELEVAWSCPRCVMTTIDPDTGIKDPRGDPLRTLRDFRRTRGGLMFGQNLIPRRLGRISVGDAVEVCESGHP